MNKKILFVAYQFPPLGGPGVQRSLKFARYLPEFGYDPIVFTIKEDDILKTGSQLDPTLLNEIPASVKFVRTPFYQPLRLISILNKLKIYRFFWFFFYPFFWERMALWPFKVYRNAKETTERENIKLVYTSSGPFSSLLLGYLLKKRKGLYWVADMRDPYTDAYAWSFPGKAHWYISRWFEKKILSFSDKLIVNTPEVRKLYIERGISDPEKIVVLTNGF